jgi:hypothetical protein
MKVFQEITKWEVPTPNHIYFCDDSKSKMYAYIRVGTNDVFTFKKPIRFDVRGRKFVEVPNSWGLAVEDHPQGQTWKVQGSRGDVHTVSELNGNLTCSCAGFKFRGQCKHLELAK